MPATRRKDNTRKVTNTQQKSKKAKVTLKGGKAAKKQKINEDEDEQQEPTAYEKLVAKIQEKRKSDALGNEANKKKRSRMMEEVEPSDGSTISAHFEEDGTYIDMGITAGQEKEFPSPSEEEDEESDSEPDLDEDLGIRSINNNATTSSRPTGAVGSSPACALLPDRSKKNPVNAINVDKAKKNDEGLMQTLSMIQKFMLKKGIIKEAMDIDELESFMEEDVNADSVQKVVKTMEKQTDPKSGKPPSKPRAAGKSIKINDASASKTMIYR